MAPAVEGVDDRCNVRVPEPPFFKEEFPSWLETHDDDDGLCCCSPGYLIKTEMAPLFPFTPCKSRSKCRGRNAGSPIDPRQEPPKLAPRK